MRLRLEFPDKFRLWSELVKANTDRVFIEAPAASVRLGARVPVELVVGGVLPADKIVPYEKLVTTDFALKAQAKFATQ